MQASASRIGLLSRRRPDLPPPLHRSRYRRRRLPAGMLTSSSNARLRCGSTTASTRGRRPRRGFTVAGRPPQVTIIERRAARPSARVHLNLTGGARTTTVERSRPRLRWFAGSRSLGRGEKVNPTWRPGRVRSALLAWIAPGGSARAPCRFAYGEHALLPPAQGGPAALAQRQAAGSDGCRRQGGNPEDRWPPFASGVRPPDSPGVAAAGARAAALTLAASDGETGSALSSARRLAELAVGARSASLPARLPAVAHRPEDVV